jgi:hypothetical protein
MIFEDKYLKYLGEWMKKAVSNFVFLSKNGQKKGVFF